jgi:hypothetical protein
MIMTNEALNEALILILSWLGCASIGHLIGYYRGIMDERSGKTKDLCRWDENGR